MDEIAAVLARLQPGRAAISIVKLGEGWDNVVYEVDGELIVRQSKEVDPSARGEAVRREANLLEAVAGFSTVPVPVPLFVDPDAGVSVGLCYTTGNEGRHPRRLPRHRPHPRRLRQVGGSRHHRLDRKSTRLNSSHLGISY